jgi:hypothetical protein
MDLPEGILNDWVNSGEILHRSEMLGHARCPRHFSWSRSLHLVTISRLLLHWLPRNFLAWKRFFIAPCLAAGPPVASPLIWNPDANVDSGLMPFWVAPILLSQWDDISRWAIHFLFRCLSTMVVHTSNRRNSDHTNQMQENILDNFLFCCVLKLIGLDLMIDRC